LVKKVSKLNKTNIAPWLFVLPGIMFILIFVYIPIIQNFYYSLFRMNSYSPDVTFIGFKNYIDMFSDPIFYTAIKNNSWYAIISVICQVGFGAILAIILESKFATTLNKYFRTIYFLPSVISITAVGLMWYFVYNPNLGMLNALIRKISSSDFDFAWLGNPKTAIFSIIAMSQWQYTGYIMVLIIVAIQKIPEVLYEVAKIEGANEFQKAIYITIPQIKEMLLLVCVITVIGAFKLFTEVFVMTRGGPYDSSQVLGTFMYRHAFFFDELGYAAAVATVIFIITFSLSLLQIKLAKSGK